MWPSLTLIREYRPNITFGTLKLPSGQLIQMLEPPWLDNRRNVSCIPPGFYKVEYLERSASGKYKRCWHITDVPNRSGILIHPGNYLRDTLGCNLPGMTRTNSMVCSSLNAMNAMRKELKNFYLTVI